jgi:60 kDa SS-A/Ro ribonucleoprotein
MANKTIFGSGSESAADTVNEAGGLAYKLEPKHALAQIAATGTFGNTYYNDASQQLKEVLELIEKIDDNEFLA